MPRIAARKRRWPAKRTRPRLTHPRRSSIRASALSLAGHPAERGNPASRTVGVSYLACASIVKKSRGVGRRFLSSIEQAPRLVDYKGSLDQTPLLSLLQSMQAQRATGTLQVRSGGEAFSLFFLFGHLFHAYGNGSQGEEAVFEPLAWRQGDYTFDPKSKLPTEETITAPTADILAEAKRRGVPGADNGPVAAVRSPAPSTPAPAAAAPTPQVSERSVVSQQPQPAPEETAPPTELYPLPVGKLVYESLKTAFVDFPKLLRSLSSDRLTGYLRLTGQASRGMILFYQGSLIESFYDGGAVVSTGRTAFSLFKNDVDRGEGSMDVIELSSEVVTAIYQLLTAPTILQGLLARFVDIRALLQYLQEEKIHGSLLVRAPEEMGIILLRDGQLLGAFTRGQPQLMQDPEIVTRLCADAKARIEVKAVADLDEPASVSLEEMLAMTTSVPATVYRPAPAQPSTAAAATMAPAPRVQPHPPAAAAAAPPSAEPDIDWPALMSQLNQMADAALQNRSKKVKEMLASTEHNLDGLDRTIDRISQTSIMFVDPARPPNLENGIR